MDGINTRYLTYVSICLISFIVTLLYFWYLHTTRSDTLSAFKFLKELPLDVALLEERVSFHCRPYETRHYELSQHPSHQNALIFYKDFLGKELFEEIMAQSINFVCISPFRLHISSIGPPILTTFQFLYSLSLLVHLFFLRKTGRPLSKALCRDTILFELLLIVETQWFMFFLTEAIDAARNALDDTPSSLFRYYEVFAASPVSQPYFLGFIMISVSFRFYFSLKPTRVFGPFTKLIKINAVSLILWVLVTSGFILLSGSCLYILLAEQPETCSSVFSCMKVVIEGGVGAVRFTHLGA